MAVNKVTRSDGTVLMDITPTTATAEDVASGKVFYAANGTRTVGVSQAVTNNNPTLDTEWEDVYSDWAGGYYYDPDNDYAYTQIPSTEKAWDTTQLNISVSCTPYSNMIPVKEGEEWRYRNMPVHFDSKNAEIPSIIIFDSSKEEIESYTRTFQDEWTEFTIPANGVWMAVIYANSQTYYLQKKVAKHTDKDAILAEIMSDYRSYSLVTPPTPRTLTMGYFVLGTDDIRPWETKSLHELYTQNNIPYYMAAIPSSVKACIQDDPYKTNLDYMKMCVQAGGEIVCHSADWITASNKNDFDTMYQYFCKGKKELESYGFKVRGIFKAGGENALMSSDPVIDAWAAHYFEFGDSFKNAFPYNMSRVILEQWEDYSSLDTVVNNVCTNHSFYIGTFHTADTADTAINSLLSALSNYTRGVDYDFITPSQLYDLLMPPTTSVSPSVDNNTTYGISISNNIITLTGSDGSTSTVTLPVYGGGVT